MYALKVCSIFAREKTIKLFRLRTICPIYPFKYPPKLVASLPEALTYRFMKIEENIVKELGSAWI